MTIPARPEDQTATVSLDAIAHNLRVWGQSLPAIEELSRREIPVIVLKGLPQIEDLYGNPGARTTADVDLLVPSRHAHTALEVLSGLGWEPERSDLLAWLTRRLGPERAAASSPWHLLAPANLSGCLIDLHSDAMTRNPKPPLDTGIWERAVPMSSDGVRFLVLAPEDLLLFLCYHFVTDHLPWHKLRDIELLLRRSDHLDWHYLAQRAQATGTALTFHLASGLAEGRAADSLPDDWRRVQFPHRLRASAVRRLIECFPALIETRYWGLVWLLAHDRPFDMWPVWRHMFVPDRVTVAAEYLGRWPSWPEYLAQLGRIYARRVQKTVSTAE